MHKIIAGEKTVRHGTIDGFSYMAIPYGKMPIISLHDQTPTAKPTLPPPTTALTWVTFVFFIPGLHRKEPEGEKDDRLR